MFGDGVKNNIEKMDDKYSAGNIGTRSGYSIIRLGQKLKNLSGIKGFEIHMERQRETLNADKELTHHNIILIGSQNVYEDVKDYLGDTFIAKNSNVGYNMLLTASPQFFKNMPTGELDEWMELSVNYLKDQFGENCVYAVCHMDETSPHIHALIVPKMWNERSQKMTLQGYKYFDGAVKLRGYQTSYSEAVRKKFTMLKRGRMYSKAKHIDIKKFYSIVNSSVDNLSLDELKVHTKNEELINIKMKFMQQTLNNFELKNKKIKDTNEVLSTDNEKLKANLKDMQKDFVNYNKAVEQMCRIHGINKSEFKAILEYVVKEQTNSITPTKHDLKQSLKKI